MATSHTLLPNNRYTVTDFLESSGGEELNRIWNRYKSVTGALRLPLQSRLAAATTRCPPQYSNGD